jgi:predicted transglutaminase-like cysteine proteinase
MFKARNIVLGLVSAIAMMAGASAHAGAMPFMPRGDGVGAPIGFVDLCRRDLATCGVPTTQLALLGIAAPIATNPTASVGTTPSRRFEAPAIVDEGEADLIGFETLQAWKIVDVQDFTAAGQLRETAPAVATVSGAERTTVAWMSRSEREQLKLLNQVNQTVNRIVHSASDMDLYGQAEYWSLPRVIDGKMYGDCDDYALEKRRELIEAGVPESALSMAVAVTARGESHAVLMISLKSGDWVLDNLTPWATPWQQLNYHWVERQVPGTALWTSAA